MKRKLSEIFGSLLGQPAKSKLTFPNIVRSEVGRPDLIDPTASVADCRFGGEVSVGPHSRVSEAHILGKVSIGRWTTFNGPNSDIYARINSVNIGNFVSIARNVSIQEYDHIFERASSYFIEENFFGERFGKEIVSKGDVVIGHDVWIGTQSVVLSGAEIANGAAIGANSVVAGHIPPYAIAVGSPARVIKYRFPQELIQRLQDLQWWQWSDDRIRANRSFFAGPLTAEKLDRVV
jgi:virginiamycin A acetyltransferase